MQPKILIFIQELNSPVLITNGPAVVKTQFRINQVFWLLARAFTISERVIFMRSPNKLFTYASFKARRLTISYMKVPIVLCFVVSTDLCLDATTTTLILLNTPLHYFCPSGLQANADSKSFVIEVLNNNLVYRRLVDAGFFWGWGGWDGARWVDAATPEFLFVNKTAAVCYLMMLFGFVFSHFWCEVTRWVHWTVTYDSTACDVCHSACNKSRSC